MLCLLLTFAGCRPKGILSSRQMCNVLYDLHRADAILHQAGLDYGHDEALAKYYQVVLEKHGVTQAQFDSSLVWYTDQPSRFDKIYPKIEQRCQAENNEVLKTLDDIGKPKNEPRNLPEITDVMQRTIHGLPIVLWEYPKTNAKVPFRAQNE